MENIPLFYGNVKIAMIDDYSPYIDSLEFLTGIPLVRFESAKNAAETLSAYQPYVTADVLLSGTDFSISDEKKVEEILKKIASIMSENTVFEDIGVLLADYQMPGMNGLDLLAQLQDKPFRKILITAEAPNEAVIRAFNHNTIDHYFCKNDKALHKTINTDISRQLNLYFVRMSQSVMAFFAHIRAINGNEKIRAFFYATMKEKKIKKFYLVDETGVFKLLNENDEVSFLAIHTREQLQSFADFGSTDGVSKATLDEIAQCKKIPIFCDKKFWEVEGVHWGDFLFDAQPIDAGFYFAMS